VIVETIPLGSKLSITLVDQTRHYFGGYYHVKLLAYCDIPLEQKYFEHAEEFGAAVAVMGTTVRFERVLEKMAVPESEIASVLGQLNHDFRETAAAYLAATEFVPRFVRSEFQKCMKKAPQIRSPRA
jgi:hypothetical protein